MISQAVLQFQQQQLHTHITMLENRITTLNDLIDYQKNTIENMQKEQNKELTTNGIQTERLNDVNKSTQCEINLPFVLSTNALRGTRQKIFLLCDRHGRDITEQLRRNFSKNVMQIFGKVSSTARIEEMYESLQQIVNCFTKNDYVIVIGGANNITRNQDVSISEIRKSYVNIMEATKNTNLIIFTIPFRYVNQYLNTIIENLNYDIYNMTQTYSHAKIFCINNLIKRKDYIGAGIYLTYRKKIYIGKELSDLINEIKGKYNDRNLEDCPISRKDNQLQLLPKSDSKEHQCDENGESQ